MHHHLDTSTTDREIQDNAGLQDHSAPIVDTTRKLQEELSTKTQSSWSFNLEDKADLKSDESVRTLVVSGHGHGSAPVARAACRGDRQRQGPLVGQVAEQGEAANPRAVAIARGKGQLSLARSVVACEEVTMTTHWKEAEGN
ncbi:hypothetical protein GW17_00035384 [Ensete ventricosum]|nr:hypothetical protein GW17_00035384 [Ensete ventricosum]